jgi:hypothetical protein
MLKILLLIAIIAVAALLVRNALKAATGRREGAEGSARDAPNTGVPPTDAELVRCVACGAFVPKTDAVVAGTGYRCGGAGCSPKP